MGVGLPVDSKNTCLVLFCFIYFRKTMLYAVTWLQVNSLERFQGRGKSISGKLPWEKVILTNISDFYNSKHDKRKE